MLFLRHRSLAFFACLGLVSLAALAQAPPVPEVEPLLGASSEPAPITVQPLGFHSLSSDETDSHQLQLLVENRSAIPVDAGFVAFRRISDQGMLRQFKGIRLGLDLSPGSSRTLDVNLRGFTWEAGDRLLVGPVSEELFRELEGSPTRSRTQQLRDLQRRVREPTTDRVAELEKLRQDRFPSASPENREANDLLACSQFCLDCAQIAAILCPLGTESLTCSCSEGLCEFTCR